MGCGSTLVRLFAVSGLVPGTAQATTPKTTVTTRVTATILRGFVARPPVRTDAPASAVPVRPRGKSERSQTDGRRDEPHLTPPPVIIDLP